MSLLPHRRARSLATSTGSEPAATAAPQASAQLTLIACISAQVGALGMPWLLPNEWIFGRFLLAMFGVLLFVRLWELARGVAPRGAVGVRCLAYVALLPDIRFSNSSADERRARANAARRFVRGIGKLMLLAALLWAKANWHAIVAHPVSYTYWLLLSAYLSTSGACDVLAALVMAASGHDAEEMFDAPLLASSPRDFWGRRWNLMFRNSAHRLLFTPLGGAQRPLLAVTVVFAWSALVHEYLVIASLGRSGGHMLLFFMLHGAATLLQGHWRRAYRLPRPIAVVAHTAWFGVTAPLFFEPLLSIVPLHWFSS